MFAGIRGNQETELDPLEPVLKEGGSSAEPAKALSQQPSLQPPPFFLNLRQAFLF